MSLRVLDEASAESDEARIYLNKKTPGLGSRFIDELNEVFDAVRERPLSFPKVETLPPAEPYRRALLRIFCYAVVFEVLDYETVVIAVAHQNQAPNYWFGRPTHPAES